MNWNSEELRGGARTSLVTDITGPVGCPSFPEVQRLYIPEVAATSLSTMLMGGPEPIATSTPIRGVLPESRETSFERDVEQAKDFLRRAKLRDTGRYARNSQSADSWTSGSMDMSTQGSVHPFDVTPFPVKERVKPGREEVLGQLRQHITRKEAPPAQRTESEDPLERLYASLQPQQ
ncbi:unnamed protein product, partial [Mesorhabditis spiculigera]